MNAIKINVGDKMVSIKVAWGTENADKETTYFFMNTISLYARMAAEKWRKEGSDAIAAEAERFADAFYEYLDNCGHYDKYK